MANLARYRNSKGEIYLNVASSGGVLEDFVNLDNNVFLRFIGIYPVVKLFVPEKYRAVFEQFFTAKRRATLLRHDCRSPLFFPENSVDHILRSHFLEHVYPSEAEKILKDFHRVLKPGSTLHVIVPDLEGLINEYNTSKQQGIQHAADALIGGTLLSSKTHGTLKFRLLEFFGGFGLQHHWMYDKASIQMRLLDIGFEILTQNLTPSANYRLNDSSIHLIGRKTL